jgi:hypothetical protein
MKTQKIKLFSIVLLTVIGITSCKKEQVEEQTFGAVNVYLSHVWGMNNDPFELNVPLVHPMNGDTMTFTTFKYYVSNLQLKKKDGSWWKHPESYFLVDVSNPTSLKLNVSNIPTGDYTEFKYVLGVDSLRNVSGAQSGALSTTNAMFWSWNTGYIMLKAEGTSPQSSTGNFAFHLGGFSGTTNIVTTKSVVFDQPMTVSSGKTSGIYLIANPAKLFHANPLSNGTNIMMPGPKAVEMAGNFYGSVVFDYFTE